MTTCGSIGLNTSYPASHNVSNSAKQCTEIMVNSMSGFRHKLPVCQVWVHDMTCNVTQHL